MTRTIAGVLGLLVLLVAAGCAADATTNVPAEATEAAAAAAEATETPGSEPTPEPEPTAVPEPTAAPTTEPEPTAEPDQAAVPDWQRYDYGYVNAIDMAVAARFGVDGLPDPLARVFYSQDESAGEAMAECFDTSVRAAIGDEAAERDWNPGAGPPEIDAGYDALFECVPAELIRTRAIAREVIGWNWYTRPDPLPEKSLDEPCVQELYPTDLVEFEAMWRASAFTDVRAGSCLPYAVSRIPTVLPPFEAEPTETGASLAGRRGLTLQWLSWEPDEWGAIEFVPLGDERYDVSGRQGGFDGDFVFVDGTATRVSDVELRFDGTVITRVDFLNEGALCVRQGEMQFLATQGRQFWRLQELLNCDDITTDYVDIYFG